MFLEMKLANASSTIALVKLTVNTNASPTYFDLCLG